MNGRVVRLLDRFERLGNRLPDPVTLFALGCLVVVVGSDLAARAGTAISHPGTGERVAAVSLLSRDGVRRMLTEMVRNFASFPPLGTVLVVMLGIGVAERSGLIAAALSRLVTRVPASALPAALVFAGVNASLAADAGYVVLIPLGAAIFASVGRHPLVGLGATFAGVAGGFSANLSVTALDPLLGGLTESAARLIDPAYRVAATANYYFMVASTGLLTVLGALVTTRIVEPRLGAWTPSHAGGDGGGVATVPPNTGRGLRAAGLVTAAMVALTMLMTVPRGAALRSPDGGLQPFFDAIVALLMLWFLAAGLAYGWREGAIRSDRDVAGMMGASLATMGPYIVLAFAAAQFIAYFTWSNLGIIAAVRGAETLRGFGATGLPLIVGFVVLSAGIDLLIGSASAKWALMAPVFVPMLMLLGYSPETTQAAYRVGDSVSNAITPLMPYFPVVLAFARRYDAEAGVGTLMTLMLPYAVTFLVAWTALLVAWIVAGLPLGPGVSIVYVGGGA